VQDLKQQEIEGSIQGLYWDIENAMLWGNSGSTQYGGYPQFDGLDTQVSTFSGNNQNAIDAATRPCPRLARQAHRHGGAAGRHGHPGSLVDVRHVVRPPRRRSRSSCRASSGSPTVSRSPAA
jgi:hypothetical protein